MILQTEQTRAEIAEWFEACSVHDVVENGGVCVKYKKEQIALFYFTRRNEWYATQNECPHKRQMALSRGMIGSVGQEPKIACPFHKKTFSLATGQCLNGDECSIKTYPVKVINGIVFIGIAKNQD
ncbi:MAG: nitrite reductase small subunit NirD [Gemmatimonadaceae bacterium]|nr:nitrite reductase small subunit NirD [Chitinophagaceae bacterium]